MSTQFDFDFKIEQAAHLHVIRTSLDGVEIVLEDNEYHVSLDVDRTGSVTLSEPLPTGEKITLLLNPPFTQLVDLPNQGAWNPEVLESALDKLTSCLLKLREEVSRAVKIKASSDLADLDDLLADIEALADVAPDVKALVGVKSDITACAANIAAILSAADDATNAASSAQTAANLRDEVANIKELVETAKDEVIAARDAAQAAQPISASTKGRELVGKETASEMLDLLGVDTGVPVGAMIDWPVDAVPAFWARADGSAFTRSTYADLHNALAPELTVAITSGSAVVTGIGSAQGFKAGMDIEGAEIPAGTIVQSVDGPNQITLSANATANGTICRVYRYGNGDGSTTFNLPNFTGRVARAWDPTGIVNPENSALGIEEEDQNKSHQHESGYVCNPSSDNSTNWPFGQGRTASEIGNTRELPTGNPSEGIEIAPLSSPEGGLETRGKALIVNKIIKVSGGVDDQAVLSAGSALADIAAAVAKADAVNEKLATNWVLELQVALETSLSTVVGSWQTYPINTKTIDPKNACSLSSHEFSSSVEVFCEWRVQLYAARNFQTRLYCVTDSAVVAEGESGYARDSYAHSTHSAGTCLLEAGKTYRVEYHAQAASAWLLGEASGVGSVEIYGFIKGRAV